MKRRASTHLRLTAVGGAAVALALVTAAVSLAQPSAPTGRPLSQEQQALVKAKERARGQAGIPAPSSQPGGLVPSGQPNEPNQPGAPGAPGAPDALARPFTGRVPTSKAELLAQLAAAEAAEQPYLALLEQHGGAEVARQKRAEYAAARRRLEALPDGPISQDIPGVELVPVPSSGGQ